MDSDIADLLPPELRALHHDGATIPALWPIIRDGLSAMNAASDTILSAYDSVIALLLRVYRDAIPPGTSARARFDAVATTKHVHRELREAGALDLVIDPTLLVQRIQWHEVVAFVLPELARRARFAQSAWQEAVRKAADLGHRTPTAHPAAKDRFQRYRVGVERYLALAIPAALPLRRSNFAHGRWGVGEGEWQVELDGPLHAPIRIASLTATFTSHSVERWKLKRHFHKGKELRITQRLSPAIVDLDLLHAYLRDVRAAELRSRGVAINALDPLGLGTATALFLERDSREGSIAIWGARYQEALRLGIGLLRPHMPPLDKETVRGLFSIHRMRTLFTTHWFGVVGERAPGDVMSGREIAQHYTTDSPQTLAAHYVRVTPSMAVLTAKTEPADRWENPRYFIDIMARALLATRPIDWAQIEMPRPESHNEKQKAAARELPRVARARPGQRVIKR